MVRTLFSPCSHEIDSYLSSGDVGFHWVYSVMVVLIGSINLHVSQCHHCCFPTVSWYKAHFISFSPGSLLSVRSVLGTHGAHYPYCTHNVYGADGGSEQSSTNPNPETYLVSYMINGRSHFRTQLHCSQSSFGFVCLLSWAKGQRAESGGL